MRRLFLIIILSAAAGAFAQERPCDRNELPVTDASHPNGTCYQGDDSQDSSHWNEGRHERLRPCGRDELPVTEPSHPNGTCYQTNSSQDADSSEESVSPRERQCNRPRYNPYSKTTDGTTAASGPGWVTFDDQNSFADLLHSENDVSVFTACQNLSFAEQSGVVHIGSRGATLLYEPGAALVFVHNADGSIARKWSLPACDLSKTRSATENLVFPTFSERPGTPDSTGDRGYRIFSIGLRIMSAGDVANSCP